LKSLPQPAVTLEPAPSYFGRAGLGAGELGSWRAGELGSWRAGELESWRAGELGSWRAGELESWRAGELGSRELASRRQLST
jgi:hypothetical protein